MVPSPVHPCHCRLLQIELRDWNSAAGYWGPAADGDCFIGGTGDWGAVLHGQAHEDIFFALLV